MTINISCAGGRVGIPPVRALPLLSKSIAGGSKELRYDFDPEYEAQGFSKDVIRDILRQAVRFLDQSHISKPSEYDDDAESDLNDDDPFRIYSPGIVESVDDDEIEGPEDDFGEWNGRADLVLRHKPHEDCNIEQATVLMEALWDPWTADVRWKRAATQLAEYLEDLYAKGVITVKVAVEMISHGPKEEVTYEILDPNPKLKAEWPKIQMDIFKLLQDCPQSRNAVRDLAIYKMGFVCGPKHNTVYIALDEDFEERHWRSITQIVEDYLGRTPFDLRLKIEHEYDAPPLQPASMVEWGVSREIYCFKPGVPYDAETRVQPGAAIAISGENNQSLGTLACYLAVKKEPFSRPRFVALTCGHIMQRVMQTRQLEAKDDPSTPLDRIYTIENPPRRIQEATLVMMQRSLDNCRLGFDEALRARDPERYSFMESEIAVRTRDIEAQKEWFASGKHQLGGLLAVSGSRRGLYTTPDVEEDIYRRLDWACFEVCDRRRGVNDLPGAGTTFRPGLYGLFFWQRNRLWHHPWVEPTNMDSLHRGEMVYHCGAGSGPSAGKYHEYRHLRLSAEDAQAGLGPTFEQEVLGTMEDDRVRPFGTIGDSGAMVWDRSGRALGMIFRGPSSRTYTQGTQGCLFTPIWNILVDIRRRTGWYDCAIA